MRRASKKSRKGNGGRLVVDTSFLVEMLDRGREELADVIASYREVLIPWVSLYEYLYGHLKVRGMNGALERKKIVESVGCVVWVDQEVLLKALEIDLDLRKGGRPIPFSDVIILATALKLGAHIATFNYSHFKGKGVELVP
ncbi:MAG: type II toxin-antitoxin system VapC family toxin [Candidatus Korarchaeota archaeon]|nr:type II toxin-antitoxin system VapC family toxin [Candidatus Korarchaeota archaeon]